MSKLNNHVKYIYDNTFELGTIKFGIWSGLLSTGVMTGCLYAIHPYLAVLSLPDWTLLLGFCGFYANNTVNRIVLDKDKQTVLINKLNFVGAMTAREDRCLIRDIQYMGEYKNEYMTFEYFGLPPILMKLMTMNLSKLEKDPLTGDARSESVPEEDKNTFKHFSSFMVNNHWYLIPLDTKTFKKSVITEELFNHVIHGRQKAILKYDYSALEAEDDKLKKNMEHLMELKNDQENEIEFTTET